MVFGRKGKSWPGKLPQTAREGKRGDCQQPSDVHLQSAPQGGPCEEMTSPSRHAYENVVWMVKRGLVEITCTTATITMICRQDDFERPLANHVHQYTAVLTSSHQYIHQRIQPPPSIEPQNAILPWISPKTQHHPTHLSQILHPLSTLPRIPAPIPNPTCQRRQTPLPQPPPIPRRRHLPLHRRHHSAEIALARHLAPVHARTIPIVENVRQALIPQRLLHRRLPRAALRRRSGRRCRVLRI